MPHHDGRGQLHQYLLDFLLQHKERALMILATMIMIMMCGDPNDAD
jgi:hypothetical protein